MSRFRSTLRETVAFLGIGLLVIPIAACATGMPKTETRESSLTVSQSPQLIVKNSNGSITIRSGTDPTTIKVVAVLSNPERVDYRTEQEGNTVELTVEVDDGFHFFGDDGGADIDVTVPQIIHLDLITSNGEITVENVEGSMSAETSNGRISVDRMEGSARVRTSNGKIDVHNLIGEIEAQTSNGSIDFEGEFLTGSNNSLSTSNGSINLLLSGNPSVELDASTINGNVSSELPITTTGIIDDNHLIGTIGSGASKLKIQTSNGSINIR